MARQEGHLYHVLIRWPAEDDPYGDPIARALADLGGVVVVPGVDRLYGFETAAGRDAALRRVLHAYGAGCVVPMGIVAEVSIGSQ
jgi:hypothetical protein